MKVAVFCTENCTFSITTVEGMASIYAARSKLGSVRACLVGSRWVAGCRALCAAVISVTVGCVGGRHSWDGFSFISVSLATAGGSRWVFLVEGAIVQL